jgi:hypothetical protein
MCCDQQLSQGVHFLFLLNETTIDRGSRDAIEQLDIWPSATNQTPSKDSDRISHFLSTGINAGKIEADLLTLLYLQQHSRYFITTLFYLSATFTPLT